MATHRLDELNKLNTKLKKHLIRKCNVSVEGRNVRRCNVTH